MKSSLTSSRVSAPRWVNSCGIPIGRPQIEPVTSSSQAKRLSMPRPTCDFYGSASVCLFGIAALMLSGVGWSRGRDTRLDLVLPGEDSAEPIKKRTKISRRLAPSAYRARTRRLGIVPPQSSQEKFSGGGPFSSLKMECIVPLCRGFVVSRRGRRWETFRIQGDGGRKLEEVICLSFEFYQRRDTTAKHRHVLDLS
jgi:hypothetical protein